MLVVAAHASDFVWRAGGAVATHTANDDPAYIVALSYGERGESGDLWSQPGQTIDRVKRIREAEALAAATLLGAEFECLDLGDYPLEITGRDLQALTERIRELEPHLILTHAAIDPFNPDHAATHAAVLKARALAAGAGVSSAFPTVIPPELLLFEPHQPELCDFKPTTFLDITPVFARKVAAMAELHAQRYLQTYYAQRAEHRGNHARRVSGNDGVKQAEAFQRVVPKVVTAL